MGQYSIRNELAVREALQRASVRRELLILDTPFLHVESQFAGVDGDELHAVATMSMDEALYGLHAPGLRICFPHGAGFLEAATRMLGLGSWDGISTVRLQVPLALEDDDHRGAYRVEVPEEVILEATGDANQGLQGRLVNLSTTGLRFQAPGDLLDLGLHRGASMRLHFALPEGPLVKADVILRYLQGNLAGAEFFPPLCDPTLASLSRWVFRRRDEEKRRQAQVSMDESTHEVKREGCVVVLSDDHSLVEQRLRGELAELPKIVRVDPGIRAIKEVLDMNPVMFLLHVTESGEAAETRLSMLAEFLEDRWPFVLFGTGLDNAALFALGARLKPTACFLLGPQPSPFFPRLLQGILRRGASRG